MGGPIVRTGTTPAFWNNWEKAFGKKTKSAAAKTEAKAKGAAKKAKAGKKAAKGKKK